MDVSSRSCLRRISALARREPNKHVRKINMAAVVCICLCFCYCCSVSKVVPTNKKLSACQAECLSAENDSLGVNKNNSELKSDYRVSNMPSQKVKRTTNTKTTQRKKSFNSIIAYTQGVSKKKLSLRPFSMLMTEMCSSDPNLLY